METFLGILNNNNNNKTLHFRWFLMPSNMLNSYVYPRAKAHSIGGENKAPSGIHTAYNPTSHIFTVLVHPQMIMSHSKQNLLVLWEVSCILNGLFLKSSRGFPLKVKTVICIQFQLINDVHLILVFSQFQLMSA